MLRIGILDDEEKARENLIFSLQRLFHKEENDLDIVEFQTGEELISWLQKREGEIDICFLDIEMDGMNGMDTAKKIRSFNQQVNLIFVTGYEDYVFDGYSVGAVGYLMKPFSEKNLNETVNLAISRMFQKETEVYTIQNKDGLFRLPLSDILYFYSSGRKVTAVTALREYSFYGKMSEAEERAGKDFMRIHQRYLVRADKVDSVEGEQVRIGEITLPVSRNYQKAVLMSFMKLML